MKGFFKIENQIKHKDWPFIIKGFLCYFLSAAIGYALFPTTAFFIFLISISVFFIIITLIHLYRMQRNDHMYLQYKIQCLQDINRFLPLRAPLPPMVGWAATPELALNVQKVIQANKPKLIVELGSGITTLVSAYTLEVYQPGGRIISFDHDAGFASKTAEELKLHKLEKFVDLRIAPLIPAELDGKTQIWYDQKNFRFENPIDLLVIDGPPVKTQKNSRYPAVPALYKYLSSDAIVILDDAKRDRESQTIKIWLEQFPDFSIEEKYGEKGITVLTRTSLPEPDLQTTG